MAYRIWSFITTYTFVLQGIETSLSSWCETAQRWILFVSFHYIITNPRYSFKWLLFPEYI